MPSSEFCASFIRFNNLSRLYVHLAKLAAYSVATRSPHSTIIWLSFTRFCSLSLLRSAEPTQPPDAGYFSESAYINNRPASSSNTQLHCITSIPTRFSLSSPQSEHTNHEGPHHACSSRLPCHRGLCHLGHSEYRPSQVPVLVLRYLPQSKGRKAVQPPAIQDRLLRRALQAWPRLPVLL